MFRALGFLCVLCAIVPPVSAHDEKTLDPHNATPGVRLELIKLPRVRSSTAVEFRMGATGVPRDSVFDLWTQDFGALFHRVRSGLRVDESGNVVSSRPAKAGQPPQPITVRPGPIPQGAAWSVALVSADSAIRTFAGVIPRPIVSRSGTCMLQLELVSYRGDRFVATGWGFSPGDEVTVEYQSAGRATEKRKTIAADGRLPTDVLVHDSTASAAKARYAVKSRWCEVAIHYHLGKRALSRS